jgi:photosystem II stability/assembly factor-like uncharacterized protein
LGTIIKTTNGVANWESQNSGTTNQLFSVYFSGINNGWVAGDAGTILKTTDGGVTWQSQASGTSSRLLSVYFVNSNTGWAVGNEGTIIKTSDGGTNWESQISGTSNQLLSVNFNDTNIGFVVGSSGTILKTTDGGMNWENQSNGISPWLHSVCFVDNNTGWIVGDGSTILKTTNGGVTIVKEEETFEVPADFVLYQNYPNPFNPTTTITFQISEPGFVSLKVYNVLGNEVVTLINEEKAPGKYEIKFDGSHLSSGIYFYKLQSGKFGETKKMLFLK